MVQRVFDRPKVTYTALAVLIAGLFALSAVGNSGSDAQNAKSDYGWVGAIGWFGFMIAVLVTIVYSIALLVRSRSRRRRTTA